MNLPDNSFCDNVHPADPYDVADNSHRFASGWFEDMLWSAAPTVENPLGQGILIDECTALSPSSVPPNSSAAPLAEELLLMQSTYVAAHGPELASFPVSVNDLQGFMGDGYVHCSPLSFGEEWYTVSEDDSMEDGEQDPTAAMTCWEPPSVVDHYHPSAVGSNTTETNPPVHATPNGWTLWTLD
ncbi:hypothetical protein AZE42_04737 [Rhizopogon vesiculosus]|uniref:Uncharacterized protein n=1 Tax=Rhizopogon vesiculosus TaxID=180088 RepID=A0A1J8QEF5_9AGAM|nr:hypothetical protein AZE42_04737 [Rhizopogon vesiculosus]